MRAISALESRFTGPSLTNQTGEKLMRYILPLVLFLATFAAAQTPTPGPQPWTCDSSTHTDNNGNPCLNFTTLGRPYAQTTGYTMPWDTQDGQPIPAGVYGFVAENYGYLSLVQIANDPLVSFFGWVDGTAPQEAFIYSSVGNTYVVNADGSQDWTYVFTNQQLEQSIAPGYAFSWQGTYHLHMLRVTLSCSGRAGHHACYGLHPGVGYGEISAVPVITQ